MGLLKCQAVGLKWVRACPEGEDVVNESFPEERF